MSNRLNKYYVIKNPLPVGFFYIYLDILYTSLIYKKTHKNKYNHVYF